MALGYVEAAVLGVVQGLTEFLPISSSAHLRIAGELLPSGVDPGAAFTAVTQLGTEAAVLLYFRRDIWKILRAWTLSLFRPDLRGDPDARMGWYVIVGTIPIGILGFLFEDSIDTTLRDLRIIGTTLIVFGLLLGLADRLARNAKSLDRLTLRDGALFGLAQALALVPGVSRSGGTITGGLLLGYTRAAAARYSFLLAIPAVLVSGVFKLFDIGGKAGTPPWGPTILATVIAFGVGYVVIAWFLRYISSEKHSFLPFVVYRVALGATVIALVQAGVLSAKP
jgi:undecaprenyl-diphosphatase